MKLLVLLALCALSLSGCDTAAPDGAVALPVASIQVAQLSDSPSGGAYDVFVEVQNAAGQALWRSSRQGGASLYQAVLSFPVSEVVAVPSSRQGVMVAVFRYDGSLTGSHLMARSLAFTADHLAAQPVVTLAAGVGTGTFTLRSHAAPQ